MFKDENAHLMLRRKLDNTSAHQVGNVFIHLTNLVPEVHVILLVFCENASFASIACNLSQQVLPKAVYRSATTDEAGGEDRTFNRLDGTDCEMVVEIEINSTDPGGLVGRDLSHDLLRCLECLLDGCMQIPLVAPPNEGRASHFPVEFASLIERKLQHVPVQTLSKMDEGVRSLH